MWNIFRRKKENLGKDISNAAEETFQEMREDLRWNNDKSIREINEFRKMFYKEFIATFGSEDTKKKLKELQWENE